MQSLKSIAQFYNNDKAIRYERTDPIYRKASPLKYTYSQQYWAFSIKKNLATYLRESIVNIHQKRVKRGRGTNIPPQTSREKQRRADGSTHPRRTDSGEGTQQKYYIYPVVVCNQKEGRVRDTLLLSQHFYGYCYRPNFLFITYL